MTKRLLVLLLAVASVLMLPAAPAQAHAVLLETAPPAATVLEKAPEAVTLRFNEPVSAALGGVRVLDADGERVEAGRVSRSPDGTTLRVPLENVDDGPYVVAWRVISADSHPLRGAFVFRVGAAGAGDDRDLVSRLLASEKGSPFVGGLFTGVRFAAFGALALLVGGAAFVGLVWPAGAASRRVRRLLVGAWAVALAATLAGLVLQGPYAAGLPLADGLKPSVLADVLSTRFGQVWAARVALLLAAVPLLRALHRFEHGLPRWWAGAGIVLGGALLLTPGLAGHAATGSMVALALAADMVHLAAVSIWLGGLVVLVTAVLPGRQPELVRTTVPRFSSVAFAAVVTIVVTGVFQSWRQVRELDALTSTTYGRLLLAKVITFAVLIGLATFSRRVVQARLGVSRLATPLPAGPGAMRAEAEDEATTRLRRSVGAEVVLATVVVAVTAVLVNAVPAKDALARPFSTTVEGKDVSIDLTVDPARRGANAVHLYTFEPTGAILDAPELEASLTEPERDVGPIRIRLDKVAPGHWVAPGVEIPLPGTWRIDLVTRLSEFDEVRSSATFPVR